ncbi:MAG: hypothetical protein AB3N64_06175 [Puniceicoccaceae bacterium]
MNRNQILLLPCSLFLFGCQVDVDVDMSLPGQKPKDRFPTAEIVNIFEPEGESNVRSSFRVAEGVGLIGTEETGDIFKTSDAGMSWTKVFDGGDEWDIADVRNYIRAEDGNIYITTTEPGTVGRSEDDGDTWSIMATAPASRTVGLVQLDDGSILVGLRRSRNNLISILRSSDHFASFNWIVVDAEAPRQNTTCFGYWGGPTVYAGVGFEGSGKVYQSNDYGKTWTRKAEFPAARDLMDFFKSGDDIYVLASGIATLFKSEDNGETWQKAHQFWEKGFLGQCVPFSFDGKDYWIMSATDQSQPIYRHLVMISDDGGETWNEWVNLLEMAKGKVTYANESGGGASNLAVISEDTIIVGVGNHAVQGRAFTLKITP